MKEKKNKRVDDVSLVESYSEDDDKKKKGCGASSMKSCQADKCSVDLSDAKPYHRRHKVCELHAKANLVLLAGTRQRFCQQFSRFHELSEFDEIKRSCRRRLAGHNERRRKNPTDNSKADGSNGAKSVKDNSNSIAPSTSSISQFKETANYKHFHVS